MSLNCRINAAAPEKQSHLVHPHPATAAAITTVYSQLVSELVRDLAAREFAEAKIRQLDILHTYPTSTAVLNNGSGQIISPFATPRSPIAHLAAGFLNLTVRETVRSLARSEIRRAVSDRLHADAAAHVLSNLIAGEVRAIAAEEVRNAQVYARRRGGDALGSHVSEEEGPVDAARQLLKVVMVNALLDPEGNGDAESLAAVMDAIVAGAMLFS
ncbi:hypothetical protein BC828DRAFT_393740 [Blastocladiella britannica]|nr:hypothetical protein BC828DRAFT_393740 [Blastocladiella britannica]